MQTLHPLDQLMAGVLRLRWPSPPVFSSTIACFLCCYMDSLLTLILITYPWCVELISNRAVGHCEVHSWARGRAAP